jgi:O-antigen ligase
MDSSTVHEDLSRLAWLGSGQGARERAVRLLDSAIFFGLLALIALAAIPYGAVQPQWEAAFECGVFVLAAMWIIEGYLSGAWHVRGLPVLVPLIAVIAFAFIQTLPLWPASVTAGVELRRAISTDPYQTRLFLFKLLALTLTLALLMRYTSSKRRLVALIFVVIGVGVASALFGLVRAVSQRDETGFILSQLGPGEGYAQFINRNHFAFLMEMSTGLALGLVAGGGVRRDRLPLYLAMTILMCTTLVLSNSRGGILSMLSQLIFIAFLFAAVRPRPKLLELNRSADWLQRFRSSFVVRVALVLCLVTVVAVGIVWIGGDPLVSRLEVVPGEISAQSADKRQGERRIEIWRATIQLIKAHPVTGVGFGAYWVAVPEYHDASGRVTPQEAHNDYLELLASGGMIGVALGAWFGVVLIRLALRHLRTQDSFRRAACFGALAGLFGLAVHSLFDFGLHVTVNAVVFVALVVIATLDCYAEEKDCEPAATTKHARAHYKKRSLERFEKYRST